MLIDQLRDAVQTLPFRLFTIKVSDGSAYRVTHPENLLIPRPLGRTIVWASGADRFAHIDVLMVTAVEFGGKRQSVSVNGHERRPKR